MESRKEQNNAMMEILQTGTDVQAHAQLNQAGHAMQRHQTHAPRQTNALIQDYALIIQLKQAATMMHAELDPKVLLQL